MTDELIPAYIALIRHELGLTAGADALAELAQRLEPADPREKPPARAPGITRLRRAMYDLERRRLPGPSLEEIAADLQFLQVFAADAPAMPQEAMQKLLADVMNAAPTRKVGPSPKAKSNVTPFVAPRDKNRGDE